MGTPESFDLAGQAPSQPPHSFTSGHPNPAQRIDSSTPNQSVDFESSLILPANSNNRIVLESSSARVSAAGFESTALPITGRCRRRQRTPIDSDSSGQVSEGGTGEARSSDGLSRSHSDCSRSPKRRRLETMRSDGIVPASDANGFSHASNGAGRSPGRKAIYSQNKNGDTSHTSNNELHSNGSVKSAVLHSSYFGHDREEVTRILIQSLYDLGYSGAASLLSQESGYQLETSAAAAFRSAVLEGRWSKAESILIRSFRPGGDDELTSSSGDVPRTREKLLLAEGADKSEMLFHVRQQKYLELLEARDLSAALMVLRQELTPLNYDVGRLHALSSLLMCPAEHLHDQAGWDGSISTSRGKLLGELSRFISPSVMIPDRRLAALLDQVKRSQINECLYHNTATPPSLYSDHICDRNDFPLHPSIELNQHTDEVWYCEFSHDGTKLVTASRDHSVIIYDTATFSVIHKLMEHDEGIAHASWSPDDTKLLTCSQDKKARLWSVETGRCLLPLIHHHQPVTAAVWAPDGQSFVTASLDNSSQLCHWSLRGQALYMWPCGYRVQDVAITPNGRRLIAADVDSRLHVYNFHTHDEEYCLSLSSKPTSISVSSDSRHMLVNLSEGQIQLLDIETTEIIRRFRGHKQGTFIIRSIFGGAAENFVVSGSEDSSIYIWHKENGSLVETLDGHIRGCVNAVSWNPANPSMFASAGDDYLVRIWTPFGDSINVSASSKSRLIPSSSNGFARTSALRSTSAF